MVLGRGDIVHTLLTPARIDRRPRASTVIALLVGLPLAYWVKDAVFPWAGRLFGHGDHRAFYGFWGSVVLLHWASVVVGVVALRHQGIGLSELGLPDWRRAIRTAAALVVAGAILVLLRSEFGRVTMFGSTPFFGSGAPVGALQRLVWVPVAVTAGMCEEFVYRGVALSLLRRRGLGTKASIAVAAVSFALMHGPAGIFGFPFVGTLAVLMSIVYLRTKSLVPGTVLHALLDLSVVLV